MNSPSTAPHGDACVTCSGQAIVATPCITETTVISPKRGWQAVDFRELWGCRELLCFLIWRDVKVRYKQTVMGAAWAILQPVMTMLIFSIIFGKLAGISFNGPPYALAVYAGLLPWLFFANAVSQAGVSLLNQVHLLTKIYFPRLFIPTACVGSSLVDLALSFIAYMGLMLWYGRLPGASVLLLPVLVLLTLAAALGVGYVLAGLTVIYRDFRFVVPFALQIWMYLSAAPFPAELWPERYHCLLAVNPLFGIIKAFRCVLLDRPLDWACLGISALVAVGLLAFGLYNFRRTERRFADIA